jgi:hypothetical protein
MFALSREAALMPGSRLFYKATLQIARARSDDFGALSWNCSGFAI